MEKLFLVLAAVLLLVSCETLDTVDMPYEQEFKRPGDGFVVDVEVSGFSETEYSYIINYFENKALHTMVQHRIEDDVLYMQFKILSLSLYTSLLADINSIKAIYSSNKNMRNIALPEAEFIQFVFSRISDTGASGGYYIQVLFDPYSEVNIGGFVTFTDDEGMASFNGTALDLSKAREGEIVILDAKERKVVAKQADDGFWYVRIKGVNLNQIVEKDIEVEALR